MLRRLDVHVIREIRKLYFALRKGCKSLGKSSVVAVILNALSIKMPNIVRIPRNVSHFRSPPRTHRSLMRSTDVFRLRLAMRENRPVDFWCQSHADTL